jgi:hypothetical protein
VTRGRGCDRRGERPAATILNQESMVVTSPSRTSRLHWASSTLGGMRLCSLHRGSLVPPCTALWRAIRSPQGQCPSVGSTWCQCPWWPVSVQERVVLCSHVRAAICAAVIDVDLEIHVPIASGGPVHFGSALASFCCCF